jgi:transglutaminase/protease-like cytokinesis protein 3
MKLIPLFLIFTFPFLIKAQNDFTSIDDYAKAYPNKIETIDELAKYFLKKKASELEKARMIYVWLTENINYDDDGYNSGKYGDNSSESVFETSQAVCEGFANLYVSLGEKIGLNIIKVTGLAKGYDYEKDKYDNIEEASNHAWNAINIDGVWTIFDATWGQGYGSTNSKGKLESEKEFKNCWFNLDPKISIFSHLPDENDKQFLIPIISFETFLEMPEIMPMGFFSGWLNADELLLKIKGKKVLDIPIFYDLAEDISLSAPTERLLKKSKDYFFNTKSKEFIAVFLVVDDEEWTPFIQSNSGWNYTLSAEKSGDYHVTAQISDGTYLTLLEYEIE